MDRDAVDAWLREVHDAGIKSIICLLAPEHLMLYTDLGPNRNLTDYYRDQGFDVTHFPVLDHQQPPLSETELRQVVVEYDRLSKPVLVHCSAGIDRTGMVVNYLLQRHERRGVSGMERC